MTTRISGELEIDHERGVIYFHTDNPIAANQYGTVTILRMCSLPRPIPKGVPIDVTHMYGVMYVPHPDRHGIHSEGA